jgi:site-specific DNA-methyltransferase (adenine-specific)
MKTIEELVNKIHLGKWEEVMPQIPDNSVDIIISSPPYNVSLGIENKFKTDAYDNYDDNMPYTEYLEWMDKCFKECYRVLKSGARICINVGDKKQSKEVTHVDFIVKMREIGFLMLCPIVWHKSQIGNRWAWGSYKSPAMPCFPTPFEYIIVMCKESLRHEGDPSKITVTAKEFQTNANALWEFPPETQMMKKWDHPACYPEELPYRLIQQLTYEDDIVLDMFSGVGTTCAVAKKNRRRYIGIEMSEKYYKTSLRRLGEISVTKKVVNKEGKETVVADWME